MNDLGLIVTIGAGIWAARYFIKEAKSQTEARLNGWWRYELEKKLEEQRAQFKSEQKSKSSYPELNFSSSPFFYSERESFDKGCVSFYQIKDKDHPKELLDSIVKAERFIIIASGWVSSNVLKPEMILALTAAAERGVMIYIIFGWTGFEDGKKKPKSQIDAEKKIKELSVHKNINYANTPTHEKIIALDGRKVIVGSFNWLSNSLSHDNSERSVSILGSGLCSEICFDLIRLHFPSDIGVLFNNSGVNSSTNSYKRENNKKFVNEGMGVESLKEIYCVNYEEEMQFWSEYAEQQVFWMEKKEMDDIEDAFDRDDRLSF